MAGTGAEETVCSLLSLSTAPKGEDGSTFITLITSLLKVFVVNCGGLNNAVFNFSTVQIYSFTRIQYNT